MSPVSRTKKRINAYCNLKEPITEMVVNMVIEIKNSKNIFMTWVNTTFNYCTEIGKGRMDFMGILELVVNQIDPTVIKPCPIQVYFITLIIN